MARSKDTGNRKKAYEVYRKNGKNLTKAAEEVDVSLTAVQKWKEEEDWDNKITVGQQKFKAFLEIMKQAENNDLLRVDLADFQLLEQLEAMVSEKVYFEEIVPTNWSDVIQTYRFVMEQKRLLLGKPTAHIVKDINVRVGNLSEGELDTDIERTQRAIAASVIGEGQTECAD